MIGKSAISLLAMMAVSACAMQSGDFPSLAKRSYENGTAIDSEARVTPALIANLPAPLQSAVNQALEQSNAAHKKFLGNLPGVEKRVGSARAASISSESWVVAQMDLASLEMIRSPSVSALADIDALYLAQLNTEFDGEQPGGALIIAKSRDQIQAQVKTQQDAIDVMKARLR
ncbi:MAG: hypothetical protein Pars2KO_07080 [Parasphingorhabdus sp.]